MNYKNFIIIFLFIFFLTGCSYGWFENHRTVNSLVNSAFSLIGLREKEPNLRIKSPDGQSEFLPYKAMLLLDKNMKNSIDWNKCEYIEEFDRRTLHGKEFFGFFPSWHCPAKNKMIVVFEPNRVVFYKANDILLTKAKTVNENDSPVITQMRQ